MRTFFGMILGALILLGGAYAHDSINAGTRSDGTVERPMVNWDVVGRNAGNWVGRAQSFVSQLINSKPSTPSTQSSPPQTDTMEPPSRPNAN